MRELVVISGKGGTGKTTLVASFAVLARGKAVLADCDVDAPDLHLLLRPKCEREGDFYGLGRARVDRGKCQQCGKCASVCRFEALVWEPGRYPEVDPVGCEGCGACEVVCPRGAIRIEPRPAGKWYVAETPYGPMVHARLNPGEENSGKLVRLVREEARKVATGRGLPLVICDGPPGIGCPVISSLTGAKVALVVLEPTMAGLHDAIRVLELTAHFRVFALSCINKWDINPKVASEIERTLGGRGVPVLAKIPYDEEVPKAISSGLPLVEFSHGPASRAVQFLWEAIEEWLF